MPSRAIPSIVLVAVVLLTSAAAVAQSRPDAPAVKGDPAPVYDARAFYETVSVFGASFSADGSRVLYTSDASGVYNLYSQPIAGGESAPLTDSTTDANIAISYFPRDDRILFTADQGGNELNHLYVRAIDGTVTDLTPGERLKARFGGWTRDDGGFFVLTNERDPRHFDVYRYAVKGYKRERIFLNDEAYSISEVSENGRWIALTRNRTNADNDVYLWDAKHAERAPKLITPHKGDVSHDVASFDPAGKTLYYLSDADSEFNRLWSYDLKSGKHAIVEGAAWDIMYAYFSRNAKYRVTGVNEDARTEVIVRDRDGHRLKLPSFPRGDISGVRFSRDENRMAFYVNGDTSPSNLYVLDLIAHEKRRLTNTLNPAMEEAHLVESEVVRYPSFDGLPIPALLYKPKCASPTDKTPALVWVHGGPGGQSRVGYRPVIQFLVNHGYAVLAVNNRGSSGYGKTFFHADDRKHGDVDLKDCVYGRKYLETLPWVDGSRVGIIGGSYGGYMVVAALAFEPEAFDVGVDIFGVTNWLRTLENIPPWWESFRESLYTELGDPTTDRKRLKRISPLFHADQIMKPLFVVQGANDPRVLKAESDEIVDAAMANGVPVEYLVFDDEGHGFRNRENRVEAAERYLSFLERYLRAKK